MGHNSLTNYYRTIYNMNKYHNFTHAVVENLIPFERDLYQDMIIDDLEKEKAEAERQAGAQYAFE